MKVRVNGIGIVTVSDRYKAKLTKFKRDWGSESVSLRLSNDRKKVEVKTIYYSNSQSTGFCMSVQP